MKARCWVITGWLILLALVAGCAAGIGYRGDMSYDGSYITDVPPSFYDSDPMLRQWYTAPYWHPDIGP
ncbi:MAG: hypothetical protein WC443_09335 [Desulfobaccales bacterium]